MTTGKKGPPGQARTSPDDADRVRACQRGDREAREQLVHRFQSIVEAHVTNLLHAYGCSRLISEHRAEIVQQIWGALFSRLDDIPPDDFSTWFALLRRWRTVDYLRKELAYQDQRITADERMIDRSPRNPSPTPGPEDLLDRREAQLEVRLCIEGMAPRQRDFLVLHFFRGLSYKEIAARFGIRVSSVGTLHARALKNLEKRLRERSTERIISAPRTDREG